MSNESQDQDPNAKEEVIESELVEDDVTAKTNQALQRTHQGLGLGSRDLKSPSSAIAAQIIASIQAECVMAEAHPRDLMLVKANLLKWCEDPVFAEAAIYKKPLGGDREPLKGFSIRFVETAIREMGNISVGDFVVYEDEEKRIVNVSVRDLERTTRYDHSITVKKTVERRFPREGQKILGERINSSGKKVFIVQATEEELETKLAAMISKTIRTSGLRIIPPDIKKECEKTIKTTQKRDIHAQPEEARKRIIAAFGEKGVSEVNLATYLGHSIESLTPDEIIELRAIYLTIAEGEGTWREILEAKRGPTQASPEEAPGEPISGSKLEEVKEAVRRHAAEVAAS